MVTATKASNLLPYVSWFSSAYFVGVVLGILILFFTGGGPVNFSPWGGLFGVAIVVGLSAAIAVRKFVRDHGRPLNGHERLLFAFFAPVAVMVITLALLALISLLIPTSVTIKGNWLLMLLVVALACFVVVYLVAATSAYFTQRPRTG